MENIDLINEEIVGDNEIAISALGNMETTDNINFSNECEADGELEKLKSLLNEFNLRQLLPILQTANVTYRCLQYIQKDDLIEAIPHLGLRIEFREKLFVWRKKEFGTDDETISNPNKVLNWLNRDYQNVPSPSSTKSS